MVVRGFIGTEEGGFQHITYLEVNKDQLWDDTLMMSGTSQGAQIRALGRDSLILGLSNKLARSHPAGQDWDLVRSTALHRGR